MDIKWKWLFFFLRLSAWRGRTQWLLEWFDATVLICAKAAAILPTTASAPVMRQQPGAPGKSHLEFCEHSLTRGLPVQDTRSCRNATDREIFHRASQKRNSQWLASCLLATYTATEKIQEHSKITSKKNELLKDVKYGQVLNFNKEKKYCIQQEAWVLCLGQMLRRRAHAHPAHSYWGLTLALEELTCSIFSMLQIQFCETFRQATLI